MVSLCDYCYGGGCDLCEPVLPKRPQQEMSAMGFINIIAPEHCRTSCDDENIYNGLYSSSGHTRCIRCTLLQILKKGKKPKDHHIVGFSIIDLED